MLFPVMHFNRFLMFTALGTVIKRIPPGFRFSKHIFIRGSGLKGKCSITSFNIIILNSPKSHCSVCENSFPCLSFMPHSDAIASMEGSISLCQGSPKSSKAWHLNPSSCRGSILSNPPHPRSKILEPSGKLPSAILIISRWQLRSGEFRVISAK